MKSVVLAILDGWGVSDNPQFGAITPETTPKLMELARHFPFGSLQASGVAIGLPWEEAGNSEVGHLTIGAGRILYHSLLRINNAIRDGSFFTNEVLIKAFQAQRVHIMGLLGTGTVHSSFKHLTALLEMAKRQGTKDLYLHLFSDGKDSPPREALALIEKIAEELKKTGKGEIVSLIGRDFAMNRDSNWAKTEATYRALVLGEGEQFEDPRDFLMRKYDEGLTDDKIPPAVKVNSSRINDGDSVIFFDFREDSVRQLTESFLLPDYVGFKNPPKSFLNLRFTTMTQYAPTYPAKVVFEPYSIKNTLGEVLSANNLKQFRIAETQKYAHITYFFNGSKEFRLAGETREIVPSLSLDKLRGNPIMSADQIMDKIIGVFHRSEYAFILANFANADMLGHTGDLQATKEGIRAIDGLAGDLAQEILKTDSYLIITADHGNAEAMINPMTGEKLTEHTTNPVPIYLISRDLEGRAIRAGKPIGLLSDIAPTILKILDLPVPIEMTGTDLLESL